ncbi:MAG: hypothetical protein A2Z25_07120 [Planctomycetes bacterium RBG_16_55_9]|nr:MAG: hypothetical protein A2Z25_07120 [Planctomycetes bacterium RBG_16_55_9]
MWKDPIVEEVRRIREKQAESHNFDIRRIIADARAKQGTSGHPMASFVKKRRSLRPKRKAARS